jgi:hypothetical protein
LCPIDYIEVMSDIRFPAYGFLNRGSQVRILPGTVSLSDTICSVSLWCVAYLGSFVCDFL